MANENEESEDMRARAYVSPSEAEAWVKHRDHRMNVSLEEYKLSPISWQIGSTIWSLSCRTKVAAYWKPSCAVTHGCSPYVLVGSHDKIQNICWANTK